MPGRPGRAFFSFNKFDVNFTASVGNDVKWEQDQWLVANTKKKMKKKIANVKDLAKPGKDVIYKKIFSD